MLGKDVSRSGYPSCLTLRLWQVADLSAFTLILFAKKILEENPAQRLDYINDITSVLLVILPLNSLINDQVQKLLATGLSVTALNVISNVSSLNDSKDIECDLTEQDKREKLVHGYYNLLFVHPEALISSKFG